MGTSESVLPGEPGKFAKLGFPEGTESHPQKEVGQDVRPKSHGKTAVASDHMCGSVTSVSAFLDGIPGQFWPVLV